MGFIYCVTALVQNTSMAASILAIYITAQVIAVISDLGWNSCLPRLLHKFPYMTPHKLSGLYVIQLSIFIVATAFYLSRSIDQAQFLVFIIFLTAQFVFRFCCNLLRTTGFYGFESVVTLVGTAPAFLIYLALKGQLSLTLMIALLAVSQMLATVAGMIKVWKTSNNAKPRDKDPLRLRNYKVIFCYSFPFGLMAIVAILIQNIDTLLIGNFQVEKLSQIFSEYILAVRFIYIPTFVCLVLQRVMVQFFSSDFERIETETDLFRCLEGHSLGEEVKVRVIRRVAVEGGYFPEEVILRLKLTVSSGGRVLDTVDTVNSK